MPFDGNGNWTSNFNAEADRDAGYKILASRFDNILLADIAQSFENCLTKDTQVKPQQNFNANNYRVINVADPVDTKDAVNLGTLTGGDNTYSGNNTFTGTNNFTGTITATTKGNTDSSTNVATTEYVTNHRCTTPATTTSTASVNAPAYVVENYYDSSTGSWYRIWSDGWIEQGGVESRTTTSGETFDKTVNLLKPMSSTNYMVSATPFRNDDFVSYTGYYSAVCAYKTTSSIRLMAYGLNTSQFISGVTWSVCGY